MVTEFGRELLTMLDDREMSCYELGEVSLLGADTISRLVNGRRRPNERQVLRILSSLLLAKAGKRERDEADRLMEVAELYPFGKLRRGRNSNGGR